MAPGIPKRPANPLDRAANRDAMAATNIDMLIGNVNFATGPHPNDATAPIFGGRWVTGETWPDDLRIVDHPVNDLSGPGQPMKLLPRAGRGMAAAPGPEPILTARGPAKSFGAFRVLHDPGFEVLPGEVPGILGPDGAGKTTRFNRISGDRHADAGSLAFDGAALKGAPPGRRCRRGIGRICQIPRPSGGTTAFGNLLVAASFGGGMGERGSHAFRVAVRATAALRRRRTCRRGRPPCSTARGQDARVRAPRGRSACCPTRSRAG